MPNYRPSCRSETVLLLAEVYFFQWNGSIDKITYCLHEAKSALSSLLLRASQAQREAET